MDKLKSLLLPLALVFAGIAIFETGVSYGSTNMRAHAIAEQLQISMQVAMRGEALENKPLKGTYVGLIDNGIAVGCLQREIWYLNKQARKNLEKTLAHALSARGSDNVIKHLEAIQESTTNTTNLSEAIEAIRKAKVDLIDNAPKTVDAAAPVMPEAAADQ